MHGGLSRIFRSKGTKLAPKTNLTKFKANSKKSNGSVIKNLPMQETEETQVWSLGWKDPLEKEMATHFSTPVWEIPWTENPGGLQSMRLQKSQTCSFQFNCSVVSHSLRPHELQHTRPSCPSPTLWVYSNSSPLSRSCCLTVSSSVITFSSCLQSFPASGSFLMSQLFASDGQNIGVSASASVLPMNTQDWSPLGWTSWISLHSKGLSRVFSNTSVQKHQFFDTQFSL